MVLCFYHSSARQGLKLFSSCLSIRSLLVVHCTAHGSIDQVDNLTWHSMAWQVPKSASLASQGRRARDNASSTSASHAQAFFRFGVPTPSCLSRAHAPWTASGLASMEWAVVHWLELCWFSSGSRPQALQVQLVSTIPPLSSSYKFKAWSK